MMIGLVSVVKRSSCKMILRKSRRQLIATLYVKLAYENYRLIAAPRKYDVLRTNVLVLRTSNFQGQLSDRYSRDINTLLSLLFTTSIFFCAPAQNSYGIISNFLNQWKREALKRASCGDCDMEMCHSLTPAHSLRCRHSS